MTETQLDGLLDELVRVDIRPGWDDVRHRARRAQRRYTAVVLLIAALVLAPATWAAVHAFEGTPAPPPIRHTFQLSNRLRAEVAKSLGKESPEVRVAKAHGVLQVRTSSGALDLWAAPTTKGGTCFWVGWDTAQSRSLPATGTGGCLERSDPPLVGGTFEGGGPPRYAGLAGDATGSEATVRVALTTGHTLTLPVVEHFFLAVVRAGADVSSITGLDAHGNVVARWKPNAGG